MSRRVMFAAALLALPVVAGLATFACGRGGSPATKPSAAAVTPTALPTQALPPTPTPRARVERTWAAPTPALAAAVGRPDCAQGSNAYKDPDGHFSLCYPAGLDVTADAVRIDQPEVRGLSLNIATARDAQGVAEDGFFIAMGWSVHPEINLGVDLARNCPQSPLLMYQDSCVPVKIQIARRTAVGCLATGLSDNGLPPPMEALHVVIPVSSSGGPEQGYVNLLVDYRGPDLAAAEAAARLVIDTLVIP